MPFEKQHTGSSFPFPVSLELLGEGYAGSIWRPQCKPKIHRKLRITEDARSVIKDWAPTAHYRCDPGYTTLSL